MTMLEHTVNDSQQANEETVSEQTSNPAPESETTASETSEDLPQKD